MINSKNSFNTIYFFILMVGAGQSIVFAIFPPLARDLTITEFQTGLIISSAALISFLSSTFWGRKVDSSGSKRVLITGVIGYALFNLLFAAILWYALLRHLNVLVTITLLLITRCLFAIFSAAIMPAAQTYIINHTTLNQRSSKMAIVGMMFGLGMILGPAIASIIIPWGILIPLILSSIVMLLPLTIAIKSISPNRYSDLTTKPQTNKLNLFDKRLRTSIVLMSIAFIVFSSTQQTIAFFIQDNHQISTIATAKWVSIAFTVSAISSVINQGIIIQRWKPSANTMINLGIMALLLTLILLFISSNIYMILIAFAFFGIANGFIYPGIISHASQRCEANIQGQVTAILQAAMSLGFIAGPVIGSGLYPYLHNQLYLMLLGILTMCILYISINNHRIKQQ
jgi:Arabinose efflux permease